MEIVTHTRDVIQTGMELNVSTAESLRAIYTVSTEISEISEHLVDAVQGQERALKRQHRLHIGVIPALDKSAGIFRVIFYRYYAPALDHDRNICCRPQSAKRRRNKPIQRAAGERSGSTSGTGTEIFFEGGIANETKV